MGETSEEGRRDKSRQEAKREEESALAEAANITKRQSDWQQINQAKYANPMTGILISHTYKYTLHNLSLFIYRCRLKRNIKLVAN